MRTYEGYREIKQLVTRKERDILMQKGWRIMEVVHSPDGNRFIMGFPEQTEEVETR